MTLTRQIPPYVHYVYGLSPTFGGRPFAFMQYLCMMSALRVLKPEVIYFHHVYEPSGWYWDQWKRAVSESGTTRLELVKQRDVTEVFGNPVEHFAHKADVLRLEVLRDYGGVYLDVDVLVIKGEHLAELLVLDPFFSSGASDANRFLDFPYARLYTSISPRDGHGHGVSAKSRPETPSLGPLQRHYAKQAS